MILLYILLIIIGVVVLIVACKAFLDSYKISDDFIGKLLTFFQYDILALFALGVLLIIIGVLFANDINIFRIN